MTTIGVPTLLAHHRLSGATAQLRRDAEVSRVEVVTGRIDNLPKALGRSVGAAHLMRKAVDDIAGQRQAIARAELRSSIAQSVLGAIGSNATVLNAQVADAIGRFDETALGATVVEARAGLETAISRLNTRSEGIALFAGDAADAEPLADAATLIADIAALYAAAATPAQFETDLDFYFNDPAGGFATSIYQGGAGDLASLEIAPGETIVATARADEQGVRDLLRGFAVLAVAGAAAPSTARDSTLMAAGSRLVAGADGVLDIRTRIGVEQARVGDVTSRLDAEEPVLTEAYNALTSRDPFEAAARLQALETQIDASFVLTARAARLSLTNYL